MDRQNSTKAMVEASLLTAITIVFILMSSYIPFFKIVGVFLLPIPITLVYFRHGLKFSILSFAVTLLIALITVNQVDAIWYVSMYVLPGVALGYCLSKRKSIFTTITMMSFTILAGILISNQAFTIIIGKDPIALLIDTTLTTYKTFNDMYIKMGVPVETMKSFMQMLPDENMMRMMIPSALMLSAAFAAVACYMITRAILKRFKYSLPSFSPFSEWYIPSKAALIVIVLFAVSIALVYMRVDNGQTYSFTASTLFVLFFTVNAASFIEWFLKRKNIHWLLRVIIILFGVLSAIGKFIYLLGICDFIFDFRKLDPVRRMPDEQ